MQKESLTCLIMATLIEAKPFIKGLSLTKTSEKPFPVYRAGNIIAVISGVGKSNSAMATAYACLKFNPQPLVNLGAAGATDCYPLGANLHVNRAVEYDNPCVGAVSPHYLRQVAEAKASGPQTARPGLRSKAPHQHTPDIFKGFPLAGIATLDRPALKAAERRRLAKKAQLVDMESAAFIQACRKFGKKCYVFKFVTDTPKTTHGSDIVFNIKKYRDQFFDFFLQSVINRL